MKPSKNVAVIPARGGSKRIPKKNIKQFSGKPIIAYSIEAALGSQLFDQVIVTTDDPEIAHVAKRWGAEIPFERPPELSGDYTPTLPVIRHAIHSLEARQQAELERVCCIYATAPFLDVSRLVEGHGLLEENKSLDFVFSATRYPFPIQRALYLEPSDQTARMFQPQHANTRSQDLVEAFHDAGQFYWGRRDAFLDQENIFTASSAPVLLPRNQVQDIDTLEDWDCAEQLYQNRNFLCR